MCLFPFIFSQLRTNKKAWHWVSIEGVVCIVLFSCSLVSQSCFVNFDVWHLFVMYQFLWWTNMSQKENILKEFSDHLLLYNQTGSFALSNIVLLLQYFLTFVHWTWQKLHIHFYCCIIAGFQLQTRVVMIMTLILVASDMGCLSDVSMNSPKQDVSHT